MKNKTIWAAWLQGYKELKSESPFHTSVICLEKWKTLNPDWSVNVISESEISYYIPEYFQIIENSPERSVQARSDLIRILLLDKFGGLWVDASCLPVQPLSEFYKKIMNESGFFAYRFSERNISHNCEIEICSWFLCVDKPEHYLISSWKKSFIEKFCTYKTWPYYTFHATLTELYDSDPKINNLINSMVQLDQSIPHSAEKPNSWQDRAPSFVYKRPVRHKDWVNFC